MVWYVAVVAILNLALGYALAVMLGTKRGRTALPTGDSSESSAPAEF